MQLTDGSAVPITPGLAFERLLDLELVAACVRGGEIEMPDAAGVCGTCMVKQAAECLATRLADAGRPAAKNVPQDS